MHTGLEKEEAIVCRVQVEFKLRLEGDSVVMDVNVENGCFGLGVPFQLLFKLGLRPSRDGSALTVTL